MQEKKFVNIPEKGKFNYQTFLEDITRNSLITSKDTTPFSIPSHPNYEASEEKRRPNLPRNIKGGKSNDTEEAKSKDTMEIFNFDDNGSKMNDNPHVIHQMEPQGDIVPNPEPEMMQPPPFTFKETTQNPKMLIQTPKGLYRNATPFIISSARLPETQKILNSFRNEGEIIDPNNLEVKISATSNKQGTTCLICFDKIPDAVFMECGHGGYITNFFFYFLIICMLFILIINSGVCYNTFDFEFFLKGFAMIVPWSYGNQQENVIYVEMYKLIF